jgi:hypothetical protein
MSNLPFEAFDILVYENVALGMCARAKSTGLMAWLFAGFDLP